MIPSQLIIIVGIGILGIWALYKLQRDFSMRLFYVIGIWLFLIQGLANSYGFIIDFPLLPLWAKISRIGSISFNFLITYLFYFLMKTAPASQGGAGTQLTPEEVNDFLEIDLEEEIKEKTRSHIKKNGERQKLRRPCSICGNYFIPGGKCCKMCEDCKEKRIKEKADKKNGEA